MVRRKTALRYLKNQRYTLQAWLRSVERWLESVAKEDREYWELMRERESIRQSLRRLSADIKVLG